MSDLIKESQNKKRGLGRGIGSLLQVHGAEEATAMAPAKASPESPARAAAAVVAPAEPSATSDKIWMLSIEKLKSGKYQPRKHFNKTAIEELAASIKEHGILQPLVVRAAGEGTFEIVAGERRWRAAQAAGMHEVPAIIRTYDNQKTLELSLIENLQRENLNPIEEAEGYQRLMSEFSLTQEKVAEKVGKERATVANALRLLKLAPEVRQLVQTGQISQGHAKVLLTLQDGSAQKSLAKLVMEKSLSVRKLEDLVQRKIGGLEGSSTQEESASMQNSVTQRLISGLADEMQKLLGTKVTIDYAKSKGKMSLYFYSDEELTQLIEKLRAGATN